MFSLEGHVAIVTGAGRGLGRAHAETLAKAGAAVGLLDVVIDDRGPRSEDDLDAMGRLALEKGIHGAAAAAELIRRDGGRAVAVRADVSDEGDVAGAVEEVVEALGEPTILVNNAAIFAERARLEDQQVSVWRRDFDVNVVGCLNMMQACWPHMKAAEWGRVINISSAAGVMGSFGHANYSATKAAIIGLTKSAALEGGRHGITVNAVAPGPVDTEVFNLKAEVGARTDINERVVKATALKRRGTPEEISSSVAYLASPEAGFVTGQVLLVAGGLDLFVF